ncbi:putative sulfate exporter family transporter [Peptoniphilus sp. MSJ-1]|uniref:Sulfate exporter family transporter n=1 Tax=Peptoniphilus ovalis TaxID=2841503 RepID=A0ABS6FF81_9FIRM|nr:putative sulfate exporter family transporter [Peptoniphilus ovalis]MBU5668849.1 putative sulfate exporter family transporter [Peptoniphilus ovalis]
MTEKSVLDYLPGIALSFVIAIVARLIEGVVPSGMIGASVIALFLGILINHFYTPSSKLEVGIGFTSKKILKFAIILLGASLNINMVLQVGKLSLYVMVFTLFTCFGVGYFSGKALGLNWKMSNLISAGTGICGGSAIAAIAPVIDADDTDIAFGMSATFIFDMFMIILFPIMGRALGLTDMAYGLWAGTAVNDTSSVVAAGYAFSEAAGDFATMVKLTRTLSIIPTVIIFAIIHARLQAKQHKANGGAELNIVKIVPWFIFGFLALVAINSLGFISPELSHTLKSISRFLMVASLAAIGLNTSFKAMKKAGPAPMIHGFFISLLVIVVALGVEVAMGLVTF